MRKKGLLFLALCVFAAATRDAQATLGERNSSVERDRRAFQMQRSAEPAQGGQYTVQTLAGGGVSVREYVSPDGKVFAVTWRGIRHPDLSVLLGSYFSELTTAAAGPERGLRATSTRTPRLVLRRSGHMRELCGGAFVPGLVPDGVNPEELP